MPTPQQDENDPKSCSTDDSSVKPPILEPRRRSVRFAKPENEVVESGREKDSPMQGDDVILVDTPDSQKDSPKKAGASSESMRSTDSSVQEIVVDKQELDPVVISSDTEKSVEASSEGNSQSLLDSDKAVLTPRRRKQLKIKDMLSASDSSQNDSEKSSQESQPGAKKKRGRRSLRGVATPTPQPVRVTRRSRSLSSDQSVDDESNSKSLEIRKKQGIMISLAEETQAEDDVKMKPVIVIAEETQNLSPKSRGNETETSESIQETPVKEQLTEPMETSGTECMASKELFKDTEEEVRIEIESGKQSQSVDVEQSLEVVIPDNASPDVVDLCGESLSPVVKLHKLTSSEIKRFDSPKGRTPEGSKVASANQVTEAGRLSLRRKSSALKLVINKENEDKKEVKAEELSDSQLSTGFDVTDGVVFGTHDAESKEENALPEGLIPDIEPMDFDTDAFGGSNATLIDQKSQEERITPEESESLSGSTSGKTSEREESSCDGTPAVPQFKNATVEEDGCMCSLPCGQEMDRPVPVDEGSDQEEPEKEDEGVARSQSQTSGKEKEACELGESQESSSQSSPQKSEQLSEEDGKEEATEISEAAVDENPLNASVDSDDMPLCSKKLSLASDSEDDLPLSLMSQSLSPQSESEMGDEDSVLDNATDSEVQIVTSTPQHKLVKSLSAQQRRELKKLKIDMRSPLLKRLRSKGKLTLRSRRLNKSLDSSQRKSRRSRRRKGKQTSQDDLAVGLHKDDSILSETDDSFINKVDEEGTKDDAPLVEENLAEESVPAREEEPLGESALEEPTHSSPVKSSLKPSPTRLSPPPKISPNKLDIPSKYRSMSRASLILQKARTTFAKPLTPMVATRKRTLPGSKTPRDSKPAGILKVSPSQECPSEVTSGLKESPARPSFRPIQVSDITRSPPF